VRLPIVQFADDARALINGGNFHRFNILNQYLYSEINKLSCLHEIDIPKCINVHSIYRTKLGVISVFCFIIFNMFLDVFFLILREKVHYATESIEAELHKRKLSLLYSMLASDNSKIKEIINRQISVNYDEDSFFCNIRDILILYDLPSITDLQANLPSKIRWKKLVRKKV
jgi:hypothetical protein